MVNQTARGHANIDNETKLSEKSESQSSDYFNHAMLSFKSALVLCPFDQRMDKFMTILCGFVQSKM